jgi:Stress responsive A/B Barrel Domain
MVHHVALYKLRPEVPSGTLDDMIRRTRSLLLKIPEVLAVRCGKQIDNDSEWPFFIAIDFESRARQAMFYDDPVYLKFLVEVIEPFTAECMHMDYEMEPGKNVKYS